LRPCMARCVAWRVAVYRLRRTCFVLCPPSALGSHFVIQTRLASGLSVQAATSAVLLEGSHSESNTGTSPLYTLKTSLSKGYTGRSTIEIVVGHVVVEVVVHAVPALVVVANARAEKTLA